MSHNSKIEWTETTWNPVTGCTKISAGCKYCYAEVMTRRLKAMGQEKYQAGFDTIVTHESSLDAPMLWKKPKLVFVNSMSDLFHKEVPLDFIKRVFRVMNHCSQHTFQVLTKRADRLLELHEKLTWTPNIWMGVSVEDARVLHRVDALRQTNAKVKFLSCEPLIGPLAYIDLQGIHQVIVGGESGVKKRPFNCDWARSIRDQCRKSDVAFFMKQVDKVQPIPDDLKIFELPKIQTA